MYGILAFVMLMETRTACSAVDGGPPLCYEYEVDGGGSGVRTFGHFFDPEGERKDPDCDEDVSSCKTEEEPDEAKQCRKTDEATDIIARTLEPELRNLCASSGNEWGATIYRDGGEITHSSIYSSGEPTFIDHAENYQSQSIEPSNIVGFIHCHPRGDARVSTGDRRTLLSFGFWLRSHYSGREADLRTYVVGDEQAGMTERQFTEDEGCERDANR